MTAAASGSDEHRDTGVTRLPVTVLILTFNEELHIARCISRIAPYVERVIVIDSFSTDQTMEIARGLGAEAVQRAFVTQSEQFQWAQDTLPLTSDWILRLDADEYLEDGLLRSLEQTLEHLDAGVTGLDFKLKVIFKGHFLRWGGYYETWLTRMWRRGAGYYDTRLMDEKITLRHGRSLRVARGDLVDENLNDITWWTEKHNRYATRQMADFIAVEYGLSDYGRAVSDTSSASGLNSHNKVKRFLRHSVYRRVPLYVRSVLYFLYRYLLRLGFLDGKVGFVWHSLQGFWYFMLTDVKIEEARTYIAKHGPDAFKEHLLQRHNIKL